MIYSILGPGADDRLWQRAHRKPDEEATELGEGAIGAPS